MILSQSIILSNDPEIIKVCKELGDEIGVNVISQPDLANFLLGLQDKDLQVAMLDCTHLETQMLKWVKVVKRIRPKIPLIIFSKKVDKKTGGKLYDEGTFYLCLKPVKKNLLRDVITAALSVYRRSDVYKN